MFEILKERMAENKDAGPATQQEKNKEGEKEAKTEKKIHFTQIEVEQKKPWPPHTASRKKDTIIPQKCSIVHESGQYRTAALTSSPL